jgi:SAM-dependent methyltransferase
MMPLKWVSTAHGTTATEDAIHKRHAQIERGSKFFEDQINNVKALVKANEKDFLLDIGCFTGKFEAIFSKTCRIFGVDINEKALDVARNYCKRKGNPKNCAFFLRNRPLDKMFGEQKFSKVLMLDFTEHVPDSELEKTLREIKPIMGKGGELIIYTPNRGHWSEWLRVVGVDRSEGHINLKKPKELKGLIEMNGFRVKELYLLPSATIIAPIEKLFPFEFMKKRICLKAALK